MMFAPDIAYLVVGLLAAGSGIIFLITDWRGPASRALGGCLLFIGLDLLLQGTLVADGSWWINLLGQALEALAIVAGIEWGLRIGQTANKRPRAIARVLFRVAQLLTVVYWLLSVGYLLLFPEYATTDVEGIVRARGAEFAVFAPVLGAAMLLSAIAIGVLLLTRIDSAEAPRLRALFFAAPFFISGLVINNDWVPVSIALGLLIFLSGSVRYLIIQGRRGQFMRQFLSPQVARMVQTEGLDRALQRERRVLSVVVCDLRGFTALARERDSGPVMQMLEDYYDVVGAVAATHGGTIKDHAGDGVLILVGAPVATPDHAQRAALLSLELIERGQRFLRGLTADLGLGIGIATGNVTVGTIKGAGRLEYVAVGNPVNLAARLCERAGDGEILADTRTTDALQTQEGIIVEERAPEPLKGFPQPIPVCALRTQSPPRLTETETLPRRRRGRRGRGKQRKSE